MTHHGIDMADGRMAAFCQRYGIKRLRLFGSILGENFLPESDVDVLVDFEPGQKVGLILLSRIERELGELLGRRVDLRTPAELSRYFRDEVLKTAELQYAKE